MSKPMDERRFPELIRNLYRIVGELETMFPGRHFTPDGHLVGSLGECLAAHYYGVELHSASHPGHDGKCAGRDVQIKATQRDSVELHGEVCHLLVLRLDREGGFEEVFNGPGGVVWEQIKNKKATSAGYRPISLVQLRLLANTVPDADRLHRIRQPVGTTCQ